MQNVSDNWKQIHNKQLLNEGFVDIAMYVTDPEPVTETVSANGTASYSRPEQILDYTYINNENYATVEPCFWLLDGSMTTLPSDTSECFTGYVGDKMSKTGGVYDVNPVITVTYSAQRTKLLPGITIVWGDKCGEWARDFNIRIYNGETLVTSKSVTDNTDIESVARFDFQNYDKVEVEIVKWCIPKRFPRISKIIVGIMKTFGKKDLQSFSYSRDVSPVCGSLPNTKADFSIMNLDNEYDFFSPNSWTRYLTEQQLVTLTYGFRLDNNAIERIQGDTLYLTEWKAPQNGITASFSAGNVFSRMSKSYKKGVFAESNMFALAESVLQDIDFDIDYQIDESLKTIPVTAPLPIATHAVCLQLIAQASGCALLCDRNGKVIIKPLTYELSNDYVLSGFNQYSKPEIELQNRIAGIEIAVNGYVEKENTELYKETLNVTGTKTIEVTYSAQAKNAVATVSGGTLNSAVYYANCCELNITANGKVTVTVNGKSTEATAQNYVLNVSERGEVLTVANSLITTAEQAENVAPRLLTYLGKRQRITSSSFRADPRLDALDIISVENEYGNKAIMVDSMSLSFTGCFKGSAGGVVVEPSMDNSGI